MSTQQQLDALTAQMRADEIRRQLYTTPQPAGGRGVVRSPPSLPSKKRKVSADSGYGSTMASPTPPEKKRRRKASSPASTPPPPPPPAEVLPSFDEVWRDFSATFGYCFSADMAWFEQSDVLPESPALSTPISADRQQTGRTCSFGPSESVLADQIKFQQQSKAMQARLRQPAQAPPQAPPPTPKPCVIDLTQDDPQQNDVFRAMVQDIGCSSQQPPAEKSERSLEEIEKDLAAALAAWRREEGLE